MMFYWLFIELKAGIVLDVLSAEDGALCGERVCFVERRLQPSAALPTPRRTH